MKITKARSGSTKFLPLEQLTVTTVAARAARLRVADGAGRTYIDRPIAAGKPARFKVRGESGRQVLTVLGKAGEVLDEAAIRLAPKTAIACDRGPYAKLMVALQQMIGRDSESRPWIINGRRHYMLVCWSRDLVYTLKAARYFIDDVQSGLDYWLETQEPNGMFWDNIYRNEAEPAPTWLGEALGKGWFKYDDGTKYIVRRVPVLADTEYVFAEGVWLAWKASGDDGWMAQQLPRLEKGLRYMTGDPLRWSKKHGLMRRSFTADEWDFANPHYCAGDHRCIHPGDPRFLFHGNQSGLYATYWRLAEMHEHLGNTRRAKELRAEGEALRKRANAKLFFGTNYGHMIPETMPEKECYALVGDERKRLSLSTGYTINRRLPTHAMAVKILEEYRRRGRAHRNESFAEWWTLDPPYRPAQWPGQHTHTAGCPEGEYMNGGICIIIAGEIAKAAFDHGREAYGADILERVWELAERDGGHLHQVYRRLPANPGPPAAKFRFVDLRAVANRGLRHGAAPGVVAWTGEGENDLRDLPVGRQMFGAVAFDVVDPARNGGRAVLALDPAAKAAPKAVTVATGALAGASLYFLHTTARGAPAGAVVGEYDVHYGDGTGEKIYVRGGQEIGHWWGTTVTSRRGDGRDHGAMMRRAWWGANPEWKNVGVYLCGWNNPHPEKPITAITVAAAKTAGGGGGIMLAGISASDRPVEFEPRIRSYGLPDCWAQAAVYYAIAEGLAGIEDTGAAFQEVSIAPRWASSQATAAAVTLHYPASDGYCSYAYRLDRQKRLVTLELAGSFRRAKVHCLLPAGRPKRVTVDGVPVPFRHARIERSNYADFTIAGVPAGPAIIEY